MKKTFFIIYSFITLIINKNSFAEHCPIASELIHNPGEDWILPDNYKLNGWNISSTEPARRSQLISMDDSFPLYVQLDPSNPYGPINASCLYKMNQDEQWGVYVYNESIIFPTRLNIRTPPFAAYKDPYGKYPNFHEYACSTAAGMATFCEYKIEN